jgi:hypothetical protein
VPEETGDHFTMGTAFEDYLNDNQKNWNVVKRRSKDNDNELTVKQDETINKMLSEFDRQPLFSVNPKKSQIEMIVNYKGHKLKIAMDNFDKEKKEIIDYKSCASIKKFQSWIEKYKMQLTFYQFVVQLKEDILCSGKIEPYSKEDVSKSIPLLATPESLLDNRGYLIEMLDNMIETLDLGIFSKGNLLEDCIECNAWSQCPHTIHKKHILI